MEFNCLGHKVNGEMDDLSQFLQLLYRFGKREVSLYVKAGNLLVTLHSFSLLIVKKKASLKGCLSLFFHMKGVLASRMPPGQHLGEVFWACSIKRRLRRWIKDTLDILRLCFLADLRTPHYLSREAGGRDQRKVNFYLVCSSITWTQINCAR